MNAMQIITAVLEAVLWYFFLWVALDAVRNKRNIWIASLCLLVLGYLAFIACPWIRETRAWEQLMQ